MALKLVTAEAKGMIMVLTCQGSMKVLRPIY